MKVCILGAGVIGGFLGTRLAAAGQAQVSALARGATLQALRTQGWRLQQGGALVQAPALASNSAAELGVQDLVVIAVKGPALAAVARMLAPLLGEQTLVMPAMNGVPWWFGHGVAALGEALGGRSTRVQRVADMLAHAGFETTHSPDVRRDIWYKLWGNMTMNPVSAITGATADKVLADPLVRSFSSAAMREAAAVGALLGCPIDQSPEDRHAITTQLGAFKTSMLQDVEAGRAIELDAIIGVVHELGLRLGVPTPSIDALFGLARLFGQVRGLYAGSP